MSKFIHLNPLFIKLYHNVFLLHYSLFGEFYLILHFPNFCPIFKAHFKYLVFIQPSLIPNSAEFFAFLL